jgi:MOSC domain-containing protein YiiM
MTEDVEQKAVNGRLTAIWTTPEGSAPMESRESIRAVEGGLEGDRYQRGTGYYSPYDVCEVTLIEAEAIETIDSSFGIDLTDGRHRRNLVTRGVEVSSLLDHRFAIGDAVFEGTRPRPPCAHVADVGGDADLTKALGEDRGGICAAVVEPGEIAVGDDIERGEPTTVDPEDLAASIRERQE